MSQQQKRCVPLDRDRPFTKRDYPRDPEEYHPSTHFGQRFKEKLRFLSGDIIEKCITEGELRDNEDGCACFVAEWGKGVKYYLIAGFHYKGYRVLVTAWPYVHDRETALDSGKWAPEELDAITERQRREAGTFDNKYSGYAEWLQEKWG